MPGYIDNGADAALYEGYNMGRAFSGAQLPVIMNQALAQWSAVNDDRTCDWCSWADTRIFDTNEEPWDPPMHWGCKCLIAYILPGEFTPPADWGQGPPPSAFPPGSTNRTGPGGKPTLSGEGKVAKPSRFKAADLRAIESDFKAMVDAGTYETDSFGVFNRGSFSSRKARNWQHDSMEKLLGTDFSEDMHQTYRSFWSAWASDSPKIGKDFVGLLDRGSIDDIVKWHAELGEAGQRKLANWLGTSRVGDNLKSANTRFISRMFEHHDAGKAVAQSAWRASGMLDADGYLTLYRGVIVKNETTREWWGNLLAKDFDFAIGAKYSESWSFARYKGDNFAAKGAQGTKGITFSKKVHVDDVLSSYLDETSYFGFEYEVLWGNVDGTLVPRSMKYNAAKTHMEVELW